jgi:fatty acid desaturase
MNDGTARSYSLAETRATGAPLRPIRWYTAPVAREELRALLEPRDGPAIRDTVIWLLLLLGSGAGAIAFWGTWWCVPFFAVYGTLYGSSTDSRWHECGHRTAFKTRWMNEAYYQLACFMILREPEVWRHSHLRHHRDTGYVGRDSEVFVPRPANLWHLAQNVFQLRSTWFALQRLVLHASGRVNAEEATYVPEEVRPSVYRTARIWLTIFAGVVVACIAMGSMLPAMFIGLPTIYGSFFVIFFGLTQHAGLAEDVPDHRLNTRTVLMNPVFRFLYWNMNYHLEHHMFPGVPYHALPRLHALTREFMPPPYPSTWAAYREILPALWRQSRDAAYYVQRRLPSDSVGGPRGGYQPLEQP